MKNYLSTMKPSLICVSSPPETSHLTLYLPVPKGSKVNDHVYCIHIQLLLILPVYFVKYLVYIPSFWMLSAPEYKKKIIICQIIIIQITYLLHYREVLTPEQEEALQTPGVSQCML